MDLTPATNQKPARTCISAWVDTQTKQRLERVGEALRVSTSEVIKRAIDAALTDAESALGLK